MIASDDMFGGVFHESLAGGRAGCRLRLSAGTLHATTDDDKTFSLALSGMLVEMGGASGKMLFCRNASRELTLFSEEPQFLEALALQAPGPIGEQLNAMRARQDRGRWFTRIAVGAVIALLVAGAVVLPPMLRSGAAMAVENLPYKVDETLGKMSIESMDLGGPVVTDERLVETVKSMLKRIEPHSKELVPGLEVTYDVRVVQSELVNAFALPGGYVVVYTGLIDAAETPEQVVGVLAHELGHVIRRHGLRRIAGSLGLYGAMQLVLGDVGGIMGIGRDLITLAAVNSYSQEQESEADKDAVAIMLGAQLDPRALGEFFTIMQASADDADALAEKGSNAVMETLPWLSSHPQLDDRRKMIETHMASKQVDAQPLEVNWQQAKEAIAQLGHEPTPPTEAEQTATKE